MERDMPEQEQQQTEEQKKQQQQVTTSLPETIRSKDGTWADDWHRKIFKDETNVQLYDRVKRFKSPDDLVRSFVSLEDKQASTGRVPKEDSPKEDWDSFRKHWGVPEKAEAYTIPDDVPKEIKETFNPEFTSSLNTLAHTIGLNQKQYAELTKWGANQALAMTQAQVETRKANEATLKKDWGSDFESRCNLASATIKNLCGSASHPFVQFLEETKMGDDPRFVKFFYDLGKELGEDEILAGDKGSESKVEDAKTKIGEIRADKAHAFNNPKHPNHKAAVAEMEGLYKLVNG